MVEKAQKEVAAKIKEEGENAAIEAAQTKERELQSQLELSRSTLEEERHRIISIAKRLDQAITTYTEGATTAHESHEKRMGELSHMQSTEAVDWLCKPVPADVRRMLGCDPSADDGDGSENRPADGIDATMY